mgnify:CR=1 FL=1
MGVIESLALLLEAISPDVDVTLGDDIDVNLEDVAQDADVRVIAQEGASKARIPDQDLVIINPEELQGDEYVRYQEFMRQGKKDTGRTTRLDKTEETKALESIDTEQFGDILSFFDGLVSDRHLAILRASLYIRIMVSNEGDLREFDVDQKKRDLAEKYGYEAYYMSHLVSSGYFDEGRYFQELHSDFDGGTGSEQYREEFEEIIGEKLIATFVNSDDTPFEVKNEIRAGLRKHLTYNPPADFYDVCGLGQNCREKINQAIENLSEEYSEMQTQDNDRGMERVVRIYPNTVRDFDI